MPVIARLILFAGRLSSPLPAEFLNLPIAATLMAAPSELATGLSGPQSGLLSL